LAAAAQALTLLCYQPVQLAGLQALLLVQSIPITRQSRGPRIVAYPDMIYWFSLLALSGAALLVIYIMQGLRRGWFRRNDEISRIKRGVNPRMFWLEVSVALGLAIGLTVISIFAATRLIGANM
jgi:hypothetical protein